ADLTLTVVDVEDAVVGISLPFPADADATHSLTGTWIQENESTYIEIEAIVPTGTSSTVANENAYQGMLNGSHMYGASFNIQIEPSNILYYSEGNPFEAPEFIEDITIKEGWDPGNINWHIDSVWPVATDGRLASPDRIAVSHHIFQNMADFAAFGEVMTITMQQSFFLRKAEQSRSVHLQAHQIELMVKLVYRTLLPPDFANEIGFELSTTHDGVTATSYVSLDQINAHISGGQP
ncbi:MAG: hypothetical protein EA401_13115, partial [Planctomycetota bacterium]